jgi:hypothetical protein
MDRHLLRTGGARALGALLLLLGPPSTAGALPLISEVSYDAAGTDDGKSFVEIYGTPGTDLAGLVVEGINGSGGSVTHTIALSGSIPADGFFVLADGLADGTTLVPEADLIGSFDFQNGPDSVVLRSGESVLDAVGYGVFAPGDVFAGEGSPAPGAPAGAIVARTFADVDTGDNAADFAVLATPTPGTGDLAAPIPEPGTALLLGLGLAGIGASGRSARARP